MGSTLEPSHLTVLVPARNAAHLLPGWLDSVSRYADTVIALDDGSTDETRTLLEAHPVVAQVLTNPVRPTYHGWDDLENRQRLVYAALSRGARWLLFLDADESLDDGDWRALQSFLASEAQAGFAYGFQVFRMIEELGTYDPHSLWVFRLFSATDAIHPLGSRRLHFVPVPSEIPRRNWLFTSLRLRHVASMTADHRAARFQKYLEADPDNDFQDDYTNLLSEPSLVQPWPDRQNDLPVLLGTEGRFADRHIEAFDPDRPVLSAVVIAQDDEDRIEASLDALALQDLDEPFEVIVICSGTDRTYELARQHSPSVRAVQLPARALPGEARNAGLWMARSDYVSFPGSHIRLLPDALAERLATHDEGWDMVAGSVTNGNTTAAGWASYILDHSTKTPSRPEGQFTGVPGSASYVTADVLGVGGFPPNIRTGEDTAVNLALHQTGRRTYFNPRISFVHTSPSVTTLQLVHHHFQRGRARGRMTRRRFDRPDFRQVRTNLDLPRRRLATIDRAMPLAGEQLQDLYRGRIRMMVAAGALGAATGAWFELLKRTPSPNATVSTSTEPESPSGPWLILSGRPGEAKHGLLASGRSAHAVQCLTTLLRYARSVCEVRPVLAPIVTSAMVTAESGGTFTTNLGPSSVEAYAKAARDAGVRFALQIQPGAKDLLDIVDEWGDLVIDESAGVYFDLRPPLAFNDQASQLSDVIAALTERGVHEPLVLVRGIDTVPAGIVGVGVPLDLRVPGTPYPHELLASGVRPDAVVYE